MAHPPQESDLIPGQIPLRLALRDGATFANFVAGPNAAALHSMRRGSEPFIFLWGGSGSGKSHLLQALCYEVAQGGDAPAYMSMSELISTSPEVFDGLEALPLVCIDDLEAVAGRPEWEAALFDLYNRVRDEGKRLVVAAQTAPGALNIGLPDLVSRLLWGPVFQLQSLSDEEKIQTLRLRARARGMDLSEEVAGYLLRHSTRDLRSLFALLDRLDQASLAAKRRLTIPFVREVLG